MTLVWSAAAATPADDLKALIAEYVAYSRLQDPIRAAQRDDMEAARRWPDDSVAAGDAGHAECINSPHSDNSEIQLISRTDERTFTRVQS